MEAVQRVGLPGEALAEGHVVDHVRHVDARGVGSYAPLHAARPRVTPKGLRVLGLTGTHGLTSYPLIGVM